MRFLVFSDLHAHNFTYKASKVPIPGLKGLYNSRLADTIAVMDEIIEYAVQNGITTVFFGGDLFHSRSSVSVDVLYAVSSRIKKFSDNGIALHMITGNHDLGDRSGNTHSLSNFPSVSAPKVFTEGGVAFHMVPYAESLDDFTEALNECTKQYVEGCPNVLLAHAGIQGARVGGDFVLESDGDIKAEDVPDTYLLSLFGHFHEHQQIKGDVYFIGATLQHNWGDAGGARGFLDVDVLGDVYTIERIETKAPKFIVAKRQEDIDAARPNDFIKVLRNDSSSTDIKVPDEMTNVEYIEQNLVEKEAGFALDSFGESDILEEWMKNRPPEGFNKDEVLKYGLELLQSEKEDKCQH